MQHEKMEIRTIMPTATENVPSRPTTIQVPNENREKMGILQNI